MTDEIRTGAFRPVGPEPDAHGQAAILLAESILHALVERAILSNAEAIDIVRTAAEVKQEVATAAHESDGRMKQSLQLLHRIADSFAADQTFNTIDGLSGWPRKSI